MRSLLAAVAVFVLASGCGQSDGDEAPRASAPIAARDPAARARDALAALGRRQVPRDLDAIVQDLALVGRDAGNPDALRLAGDLVGGRWRLARDPSDLRRALDYYRAATVDPARPGACAALRGRRDLLTESHDPGAAAAHTAFESVCVPASQRARRPATAPAGPVSATRVRRVVIDPGHGGSDPGAIGPTGLTEAAVTLDVARRVADRLAARYGIQVVLTRDEDAYVDLETRTAHANDTRSDLFVSIHCNAAPNRDAHGVATFVLDTGSERVAARVGRREGELVADDPVSSWHVARILTSLRLSGPGRQSFALAESLQGAMLHDLRLLYPAVDDLGVHPASFHVLVTARMPAVLVELSFISNAMEEQRLRAEGYRDVLAGAIARAVASYGM
jgi:N-acetylmuramoyl-L-alanine amidase